MKKMMRLVLLVSAVTISVAAQSAAAYDEVDREMIELMALDAEQAMAYVSVIEKQRVAFEQLQPGEWQQELALYRETFDLLRPVLTAQQLTIFVGVINSVIEFPDDEDLLAMEN